MRDETSDEYVQRIRKQNQHLYKRKPDKPCTFDILAEGGLMYLLLGLAFIIYIGWFAYGVIERQADWQITGMNEELEVVVLEKWWGMDKDLARAWWSDEDETWYYEDPDTHRKQRFTTEPPDSADIPDHEYR